MKWYKIDFEVDDGASYVKDSALVEGLDEEDAVDKLKNLINSLGYDTCISKIFNVVVFHGIVFTGRHGWR